MISIGIGICHLEMVSAPRKGISAPSLAPVEPMLEFGRTEHPIRQAIVTLPIAHAAGAVRVPDGPGLGIEVDRKALARFAAP
jgi:D-galactarolactone cycloisomerase